MPRFPALGRLWQEDCQLPEQGFFPGCPRTHSVDQAGFELRGLSASALLSAGITGIILRLYTDSGEGGDIPTEYSRVQGIGPWKTV